MHSDNNSVEIRAATAADAPILARLVEELAATTGLRHKFRATSENYTAHGFGKHPLFEALVASVDGETAGAAIYFYTFSSWRGEPGVYLQDIVVTAASRGRGVGSALMARIVLETRARGATHLRLAVDRSNESARTFYERLGMERADDDVIYELDGDAFLALAADDSF